MIAGLIIWVVLGLIAGFLASKIVNHHGEGAGLDILLGIVGALVGGWLFRLLGAHGATGLNLWSILVATVGAVVLLLVWHGIRSMLRHA